MTVWNDAMFESSRQFLLVMVCCVQRDVTTQLEAATKETVTSLVAASTPIMRAGAGIRNHLLLF